MISESKIYQNPVEDIFKTSLKWKPKQSQKCFYITKVFLPTFVWHFILQNYLFELKLLN